MGCTCAEHTRSDSLSTALRRTGVLLSSSPVLQPLITNADPTKTLTLRNDFIRELTRRYNELRRDIIVSVVDNDAFGLTDERAPIALLAAARPGQFAFPRSSDKVQSFLAWLDTQEAAGILEVQTGARVGSSINAAWSNKYIDTAYRKGIRRGAIELNRIGVRREIDAPPLSGSFLSPVHADRVSLIYTRTYNELQGVSDVMDARMSSVLAEGLASGRNPRQIASLLTKEVDTALSRSRTIARTEVVRAHHLANIQEYREAGIQGVSVRAEWVTAGDARVCRACKALEGKVFTLDEIENKIPLHPNCRCVAVPVVN